ncbi:M15 family metallopeptidase [Nocardioides sp.]|uniref:M15 family metallopeptidase n=1 Tax=Nocardioides sp. TaxID=35761 RepID=UPI00271F8894|nr:M15 family metallopeptidase [Nocardioides sp.]MDO9456283.1 M15 family metallopeptidase [Nocardioides sp.]
MLLLVACSSPDAPSDPAPDPAPDPVGTPTRSASSPITTTAPTVPPATSPAPGPAYSTWPLGERPLPVGPDGYGVVRPTPATLRDRRYPTRDLLPPPVGGRWRSGVGPVTPAIAARLAWEPGCPVALADLRYVTVAFRGFDDAAHTGELVVAASKAADVVSVFRALFAADFPIEEMRLTALAELDLPPTGDGNNTGAYVCRPTTGQSSGFSAHAFGLALDLDPFQNPYLKGDRVLPELASSYLDRSRVRPGMVLAGSLAVREFARIGWSWGGDFTTLRDYQHFTATGR